MAEWCLDRRDAKLSVANFVPMSTRVEAQPPLYLSGHDISRTDSETYLWMTAGYQRNDQRSEFYLYM